MAKSDFQFHSSAKSDVSSCNLFTGCHFTRSHIRIYSITITRFILCLRQVYLTDIPGSYTLALRPSCTINREPLSFSCSVSSVVVGNLGAPLRDLFQDDGDNIIDEE